MEQKEKCIFETAYLQTNYVVQGNEENQIVIRIGEINGALDELLNRYKAEIWAFVTAYNPFSKPCSSEENLIRQADLLNQLREKNLRFLGGYGKGKNEDWESQQSVFIFDIDRETAVRLGREFEQNAIVTGQIGCAPELVWC